MDQQNQGLFGSYVDPSYGVSRGPSSLSPYLNIDPSYLYQGGSPEFIFPEGASHKRGRFELAFSQIGGSVMTGAFLGGLNGVYVGARETAVAGQTGAIRRTQMFNFITRRGAAAANGLGCIAVMYSAFGVLLSWLRGTDDELNTIASGTATGMLYKSSAGLRKCARGGAAGLGISFAYCLWTSKDRLKEMIGADKFSL